MSNKQETNKKTETPTSQTSGDEFKSQLIFLPDELKNVNVDYSHFGTFNKLPGLSPKSEAPK